MSKKGEDEVSHVTTHRVEHQAAGAAAGAAVGAGNDGRAERSGRADGAGRGVPCRLLRIWTQC